MKRAPLAQRGERRARRAGGGGSISLGLTMVLFLPNAAFASALSTLADSMPPGSFAQLTTSSGLLTGGTACRTWITQQYMSLIYDPPPDGDCAGNGNGICDTILGYSHGMTWDEVTKKAFFIGGAHNGMGKIISYDEATDAWSVIKDECGEPKQGGHFYDHETLSSNHRVFMWGVGPTIYTYNIDGGTMSNLPTIPHNSSYGDVNPAHTIKFFPDRDELMLADSYIGVWVYQYSDGQWVKKRNGQYTGDWPDLFMGQYNNIGAYSAKHKVVVFGGGNGSSALFRYDDSGTLTQMPDAPFGFSLQSDNMIADPVSGNVLIFHSNSNGVCTAHEYDPTGTGAWQAVAFSAVPPYCNLGSPDLIGTSTTTIDRLGVIMFLIEGRSGPVVYLYKHLPSPVRPAAPTNLLVQ